MTEFSELPPLKRLQRYLQLASDARREADASQGGVRESYTLMAEHWEYLAKAMEETLRSERPN